MDIFKSIAAACIAAFLIDGAAWGQSPPDAGRLLEETQKSMPGPPGVKPAIEIPTFPEPAMRERKETKIFVKGFTFSIDTPAVGSEELQPVVKGYTNREVTFGELEEAADKVAQYLRDKGYFLAKAYLPRQEIVDGMVRINVMIGKVEGSVEGKAVAVEGEYKRLKESVVQKIMNKAVKAGQPARLEDLERGILLLNDLPGVAASTSLSAGGTPGTTKMSVTIIEGSLFTGHVGFDTFGNRFTGAERLVGGININNPTGYGDLITLTGVQAGEPVFDTDEGKLHLWRAGWQAPLGYSGLRGGVSFTSLAFRIGEELAITDDNGTAYVWTINASYPFVRSRVHNLLGSISYEYRNLYNALGGFTSSDKRVNSGTAGIQGDAMDRLGKGGYNIYGLALTVGDLDLGRWPIDLSVDQQTKKANGNYLKANFNGARQQNMGSGYSIYGALAGQVADKNLDSSEQMTLGGPTGVRAYPSGEAPGDEGVLVNLELRKDFPVATRLGHVQVVTFYDYGWVKQHKETWTDWNAGNPGLRNSYGINGAGAGVNISKTARYFVKAFWAAKIGGNPGQSATGLESDGQSRDHRFWLQGVLYF